MYRARESFVFGVFLFKSYACIKLNQLKNEPMLKKKQNKKKPLIPFAKSLKEIRNTSSSKVRDFLYFYL